MAATAALVTAAGTAAGAVAVPRAPSGPQALPVPVTSLLPPSLPAPSLPPFPSPTPPAVPSPTLPPQPVTAPPAPGQPGRPTPPGAAPDTPAGPPQPSVGGAAGGAPDMPPTPENAAAIIAGNPSADLYPQPPVDPATTAQARLVAQLSDVEHRMQYLTNVLARTRADLAVAQHNLGPVATLITILTAPAVTPPAGDAVDTPQGRVLALSSAISFGEAELARRQAEAQAIQQTIATRLQQAATTSAVSGGPGYGGSLRRPVPGPITSPFGNRLDPYYHVWQLHTGVDIGAPPGTPIVAAAAGRVSQAGWFGGYGNYTCIDHGQIDGQRLSTCYGHQQRILVAAGEQVSAGQVIGLVGSTGASTGPHLHFEVRLGGRPVDPLPWI